MHNRPLSEYGRRAGELAVIWFDAVLAKEPPSEPDDEAVVEELSASTVGDSDIAPQLTLIVGPSPETKIIAEEKEKFQARHSERIQFWKGLLEVANRRTQLHAGRSPTKENWIAGPSGVSGINFNYVVLEHEARVEVWIARGPGRGGENKAIFQKLFDQKDDIERAFGDKLDWQRLEGKDACRIQTTTIIGGYRDPDKWPAIYHFLTDRMVGLERAFRPRIEALNL
jgi:hypothetical protein